MRNLHSGWRGPALLAALIALGACSSSSSSGTDDVDDAAGLSLTIDSCAISMSCDEAVTLTVDGVAQEQTAAVVVSREFILDGDGLAVDPGAAGGSVVMDCDLRVDDAAGNHAERSITITLNAAGE